MQVQLNDPVVMSEEVDIKESLRADDGELLGNRDDSKSDSVRFALIYSFTPYLKK